MTRLEQQAYARLDQIARSQERIAEALERIANALDGEDLERIKEGYRR